MIVECVTLTIPNFKSYVDPGAGLVVGASYPVISITFSPGESIDFQIFAGGPDMPIHDSRLFETIDGSIPSNWVVVTRKNGTLKVGPPQLLEIGFLERYYDQDPEAVGIVEKILDGLDKSIPGPPYFYL